MSNRSYAFGSLLMADKDLFSSKVKVFLFSYAYERTFLVPVPMKPGESVICEVVVEVHKPVTQYAFNAIPHVIKDEGHLRYL